MAAFDPGWPGKEIDIDLAGELLFELQLSATRVAQLFGVSRPTLYKQMDEAGIEHSFFIVREIIVSIKEIAIITKLCLNISYYIVCYKIVKQKVLSANNF